MKVERIDHVHAYVEDLDGAAQLFGVLFGSEFSPAFEATAVGCKNCMHPRLKMELMEITDPNGLAAKAMADRKEGYIWISLKVPNIKEAIAEMESRGMKLWHYYEIGKMKEADFKPDKTFGMIIELCEYPGDDPMLAAMGGELVMRAYD
jgi:predicted enzyme related to lactoylglutathione lyase